MPPMATQPPDRTQDATAPARPRSRTVFPEKSKSWIIGFLALLLLAWGARWVHYRWTHVYIDDARIDGEVITLSSRVSGWITEMTVIQGDDVKQGQVLLRIDDRDSQLQRDVLTAKLRAIDTQMGAMRAQTGQVDLETLGRMQSESSRLAAAEAEMAALDAELRQAADDYRRAQDLAAQKWLSPQAMERTRTQYQAVQERHRKAVSEAAAVRGTLAAAGGSRRQLKVMEQQLLVLARQADEIRAEIKRREVDLTDRAILSPADGKVVMTFVKKGEHVSPGQRILMFHDPKEIWVDANVKETEVGLLRPGMPAEVRVDAYRGKVFAGEVYRVGQAATNKFALLPDPNPSGNFTKITQRLPVRILLADKDPRLRPGMMVEVSIGLRDR